MMYGRFNSHYAIVTVQLPDSQTSTASGATVSEAANLAKHYASEGFTDESDDYNVSDFCSACRFGDEPCVCGDCPCNNCAQSPCVCYDQPTDEEFDEFEDWHNDGEDYEV